MTNEIMTVGTNNDMAIAGRTANQIAAKYAFNRYQSRKAANTLKAQEQALATFADYLNYADITVDADALYTSPLAWDGMTFGLVSGFVEWMASQGYAVGSINAKLAHVKVYAKLAAQARIIDPTEYALIRTVTGFSNRDGYNLDQKRKVTRRSTKKANPVPLTRSQADRLMDQPDTPQGRRDALIMAIFLEHGLRVSEIAQLGRHALTENHLSFYSPKTHKNHRHQLTPQSANAAKAYMSKDGPAFDGLIRGSRRGGQLTDFAMGERTIARRVKLLGERIGIHKLSPHDLRHAWATFASNNGTSVKALQDAGGWASAAMPLRYAASAKVGNEGVVLRAERG